MAQVVLSHPRDWKFISELLHCDLVLLVWVFSGRLVLGNVFSANWLSGREKFSEGPHSLDPTAVETLPGMDSSSLFFFLMAAWVYVSIVRAVALLSALTK